MLRFGRHPDDRDIMALAAPALGALAADPLYSLVDTALVGNLGARELGGVAIGTAAFTASFWLFSFLVYGVTPRVARAIGAGDSRAATAIGVHALVMAVAIGVVLTMGGVVFAGPIVRLLGAGPDTVGFAEPYLRIRALAAVAVLIAQVGHGWTRGLQDTRTAMVVAVAGAVANAILDYVLIYPAGLGVQGAAWATVLGQWGVALAFVAILRRRSEGARPRRLDVGVMRSLLVVGADLLVRNGSLLLALTVATSVAARMGIVALGAWQITMQLFLFLSLVLDSVAIAAQALVGRHLGAGSPGRADELARRLMEWGIVVGVALAAALFVVRTPVAGLFADDARVVASAAALIGWLALLQPLAAAAFTLDGILIGASDTRFLAGAMAASSALYVALAVASLEAGWGTGGLAAGATVWMVARTATTGARLRGGRWTLTP
ncbi:MAG TPA: MATE family efflux transporter [Actinomycetota bacterium]|nr:MATE family efflux transporter [Actinomycetota bacterium]